jgi:molecular chaperone GrpE
MSETPRRGQNAGASGMDPFVDAEGGDPAPKRGDRGGPDEQLGQDRSFGAEGASESLAQLKQERDELKEQVLRARAEFANYQKRAKQQADSDRVYAVGSLARDLLDPLERPFDPNLHDAVMQQPSREHPEGTVVAELSKGYTIRDRVLRPSKVAVSAKPAAD